MCGDGKAKQSENEYSEFKKPSILNKGQKGEEITLITILSFQKSISSLFLYRGATSSFLSERHSSLLDCEE